MRTPPVTGSPPTPPYAVNLALYTANLDPGQCIYATSETLRIQHHHFHDIVL